MEHLTGFRDVGNDVANIKSDTDSLDRRLDVLGADIALVKDRVDKDHDVLTTVKDNTETMQETLYSVNGTTRRLCNEKVPALSTDIAGIRTKLDALATDAAKDKRDVNAKLATIQEQLTAVALMLSNLGKPPKPTGA